MTSRDRKASVTSSSISENGHDNDQYEAFQEIIQTIRSRKAKRPVSQQSSGPSTAKTRNSRYTPSVDLNLYQGGERTELTFNEEEEEEEPPHTPTEEEVNELRVRNHIKDRMQIYRNKKKEERRKLLEERKTRWIERQKRLGVYVEPSESASDSSGSSMSGLTEEERQVKREERRRLHKMIPLTTVVDELRKNLELETTMRGDLLETIRIIRGVKREEFYRTDTPEINEEDEEVEVEEETPAEEETVTEEVKPTQKLNLKGVKARVISRWPEGHRHHTKAVKADWSFLTHYSDAELTVELAYLLPEYMRDVERIRKSRRTRWNSTSNFKTKRIQRNLDFESWREEMMRIAYDEEFGRGKSKMFATVPLPKIKETSSSVNTSRSSRVSISDRADGIKSDDTLSPRRRESNVNSIPSSKQPLSPYKYNPIQKSPRQKEQMKNQLASKNRNTLHNGQNKTMSKIYRPVGRKAISLANKATKANKTSDDNIQNVKTGTFHKQNRTILTGRSNGISANGRANEPKNINLHFQSIKGDNSTSSNTSASDQLSQDIDQPGVTTITVHFNNDQNDNHTSSPDRTHVVNIPSGDTELHEQESIIRINSPVNREDYVTRLFGDIQDYRSKHPTVNHVKVELRSNDVADIDWVRQYVEDQSHSKYKAKV